MNAASIILLVLISIWAVFSAVYSHKHSGSCGGCSGCDACKGNMSGAGLGGEDLGGESFKGEVPDGEHSDIHVNTHKCSGSCGTCPYHPR